MRHCPHCGSELSDTDRFCFSCGALVEGIEDEQDEKKVEPSLTPTGSVPQASNDRPGTGTIIKVFLIVAILLAASVGGILILSNSYKEPTSTGDHTVSYEWNYNGETLKYTLTVKQTDYDSMRKSTIDHTGSLSSDRYTRTDGKIIVAVSEFIVVDKYVQKLADDLKALCKDKNGGAEPSNEKLIQFLTYFVQGAIAYDSEEGSSSSDYWRYPLETLWEKKGDCEDTAILLAALTNASGDQYKGKAGVILLPGHVMAAVDKSLYATPLAYSSKHSDVYNCDYYAIETALDGSYWEVGKINDKYSGDYFHLYLGYVTSYYGVTS